MKMKFHIPDFYLHFNLNLSLIDLINEHPEYFYDGVEIASCFGCFSPALWNGGRAFSGHINMDKIKSTIKLFNERNVPIRYTFTNPTLTEADLRDSFCNKLCREAENGFNEIICNYDVLEEYIRNTYPKYPLVSSTCKEIRDIDGLIKELEKDYKLVVLDYNWNNDFERLAQIPEQYRSRCEILINPYCIPNCPRRGEHYKILGTAQRKASLAKNSLLINQKLEKEFDDIVKSVDCTCPGLNFYQTHKFSTFVPRENLEKYMELGYNNFKIEGRTISKANVIESYMYYMVKPEHRDVLRLELLTSIKNYYVPTSYVRRT